MELIERREEGETWEEWGEDIRSVEKGTSLAHLCALEAAEVWLEEGVRVIEMVFAEDGFSRTWRSRVVPEVGIEVSSRPATSQGLYRLEYRSGPELFHETRVYFYQLRHDPARRLPTRLWFLAVAA